MAGQIVYAQLGDNDMAANMEEAMTFKKYPTYDQYDTMMHQFVSKYPEICRIDTFGYSEKGRLLLALKISDNVAIEEIEPRFLYTSTIHGDELSGYIHMLRLADFLLKEYENVGEVTSLVNDVEIWINPIFNPDGAYGNNNLNLEDASRENSLGYDLNRNFPEASNGDLDDLAGRQTETKYMMQFMREHKFNLSANIHSGAEVVNYPWDNGPNDRTKSNYEKHPDDDWFSFISREYADVAHDVNPDYMNLFTDGITNGSDWYRIEGGRQDYATFYLQGRELTLELSNYFNEPSESLETFWTYNKWSLFNLISQARYGIHGTVICSELFDPIEARITVMNYDSSYARIETAPGEYNWLRSDTLNMEEYSGAEERGSWLTSDPETGAFFRYLKEGSYDLIASADGYFNDTLRDVSIIDYQTTFLTFELDRLVANVNTDLFESGITVYPNPASDYLYVKHSDPLEAIQYIKIYSADGKLISQVNPNNLNGPVTIDISHFQNGLYLLKINSTDHSYNKAILISH